MRDRSFAAERMSHTWETSTLDKTGRRIADRAITLVHTVSAVRTFGSQPAMLRNETIRNFIASRATTQSTANTTKAKPVTDRAAKANSAAQTEPPPFDKAAPLYA